MAPKIIIGCLLLMLHSHRVSAQTVTSDQTARDCRNISQVVTQTVRTNIQDSTNFVLPPKVANAVPAVSDFSKKAEALKRPCDVTPVETANWQVEPLTREEIQTRRAEKGSTRWQDQLSLLRSQTKTTCHEEQVLNAPFWDSEEVQHSPFLAASGAVASGIQRLCGSNAVFPSTSFYALLLTKREHDPANFAKDLAQLKTTLSDGEKLNLVQEITEPPKGDAFRSARLLRELSGTDVKITVTQNPQTRMSYVVARGPGTKLQILGYGQLVMAKEPTTTDADRKPISKEDEVAVNEALKQLDGLPGAHGEKVAIAPGRAGCNSGKICDWHVAPTSTGNQYLVGTPDPGSAGSQLDPHALAALREIESRVSGPHFTGNSTADYPRLGANAPAKDKMELKYEIGGVSLSAERKGASVSYKSPVQLDVGQLSFVGETNHQQVGATDYTKGKSGGFGGINYKIIFGPNH